jgi:methyl-accepting chemotaxis protein
MDQSTQQNSALVEQMAAAASGLKNQAHEMVKVVAVFKLHDRGDGLARAGQQQVTVF